MEKWRRHKDWKCLLCKMLILHLDRITDITVSQNIPSLNTNEQTKNPAMLTQLCHSVLLWIRDWLESRRWDGSRGWFGSGKMKRVSAGGLFGFSANTSFSLGLLTRHLAGRTRGLPLSDPGLFQHWVRAHSRCTMNAYQVIEFQAW